MNTYRIYTTATVPVVIEVEAENEFQAKKFARKRAKTQGMVPLSPTNLKPKLWTICSNRPISYDTIMLRSHLHSSDNKSPDEVVVEEIRQVVSELINSAKENNDKDLKNAYMEDAKDIEKVADLLEQGKFNEAFRLYDSLDTFVREGFPDCAINYLFAKAYGTY